MQDRELLDLIQRAKSRHLKYTPIFERIENAYLALYATPNHTGKERLFIPLVGSKVRRILAAFEETYFSSEKIVQLRAKTSAHTEFVKTLQEACHYYTHQKIPLFSTLSANMLEAILYGTPIMKVYWANGGLRLENVSIYDCYLDYEAKRGSELNYFIHRLKLSRLRILKLLQNGEFKPNSPLNFPKNSLYLQEVLQEVYYKTQKGWRVATFLENHRLRDIALHDGLPFIVGNLLPQIIRKEEREYVKLYGDSPIGILIPLQAEINQRRNQQMRAIELAINPRILIQRGSGIDPNGIKRGAGEILECNDPRGVQILPSPPLNTGIFDIERLDIEAQEAIGVTHYNSGVNSQHLNQTATGISLLSSEANMRITSLLRGYNETFMEPLFKRIAKLVYTYDKKFLKEGDKPPLDLLVSINTGLGATNPQVQLSSYKEAFNLFMQLGNTKGAYQICKEVLALLGLKNQNDYFKEEESERGVRDDTHRLTSTQWMDIPI